MSVVRFPVSPDTITVLGYRVKESDPAWTGLDLANAEPRVQSTMWLAIAGADEAPPDIHLNVPWKHPDDKDYDGCMYRVRPRMESGKKWKGRKVVSASFERWDGKWYIAVCYSTTRT